MSETATSAAIRAGSDLYAAMRTADTIVKMLEDFIPYHSKRDARELLIGAAIQHGFELTSKDMRKQYEAWLETQLPTLRGPLEPPPIEPDTRPTIVVTRAMRG